MHLPATPQIGSISLYFHLVSRSAFTVPAVQDLVKGCVPEVSCKAILPAPPCWSSQAFSHHPCQCGEHTETKTTDRQTAAAAPRLPLMLNWARHTERQASLSQTP